MWTTLIMAMLLRMLMLTEMTLKSADPCLGCRVNLTTNHQPPTTKHQLQPPTTNYQSPAICNHQLGTTSLQPNPTTNNQLPLCVVISAGELWGERQLGPEGCSRTFAAAHSRSRLLTTDKVGRRHLRRSVAQVRDYAAKRSKEQVHMLPKNTPGKRKQT